MLLRSGKEKKEMQSTDSERNNCEIKFNGDKSDSLDIRTFFKILELYFAENKIEDVNKKQFLQKNLGGSALAYFINYCSHIENYEELKTELITFFEQSDSRTFEDFIKLKYDATTTAGLDDYFRSKLNLGRDLKLPTSIILEGLTNGMPHHIKIILASRDIQNHQEWITITRKLLAADTSNSIGVSPQFSSAVPQFSSATSSSFMTPYNRSFRPLRSPAATFGLRPPRSPAATYGLRQPWSPAASYRHHQPWRSVPEYHPRQSYTFHRRPPEELGPRSTQSRGQDISQPMIRTATYPAITSNQHDGRNTQN